MIKALFFISFFALRLSSMNYINSIFSYGYNIMEAFTAAPCLLLMSAHEHYYCTSDEDHTDISEGADKAIVLVHGKGANKSEFKLLRKFLKQVDFSDKNIFLPVISFNILRGKEDHNKEYWFGGRNDYDIAELSQVLYQLLNNWSEKNGINKFILIGHSLGGIVISYLEQNYDIGIDMIITINSPFYGIPLLDHGCFGLRKPDRCSNQLKTTSEILAQIRERAQNNDKYFHIVGSLDMLVPKDNSYLEQKEGHVSFHRNGHYLTVANPFVFFSILDMIDSLFDSKEDIIF